MAPDALPYTDSKPTGAPDFYFAINATFAHIERRFGEEALLAYWRDLGVQYQEPVWRRWKEGGLPAVRDYWEAFFAAEPGGEVEVVHEGDAVVLNVRTCPAISHLRAAGRDIHPTYCQHCYFMGDAAAEQAGLAARVDGGNGTCRQTFSDRASAPPQDLGAIASCVHPAEEA